MKKNKDLNVLAEKEHSVGLEVLSGPLGKQISARLKRRYPWVPMEDLYSYSVLGLAGAVKLYDKSRGVSFAGFASTKGMFCAIDEMRKDGVLRRKSLSNLPHEYTFSDAPVNSNGYSSTDVEDLNSDQDFSLMEVRDLCQVLLKGLDEESRDLLVMYYSEQKTFREIAKVFCISETSVWLRHKTLLEKLQKYVRAAGLVAA